MGRDVLTMLISGLLGGVGAAFAGAPWWNLCAPWRTLSAGPPCGIGR